ncbi:hypothetical protein [Limimaricola hongkongensis]|uniref:Uncharacterized protein n=1 Tax=Limimaricola hongkongensis DSM 17492 TaxID=1122180 RepID=A0A017HA73_9RHOB|nr:hypothetical protein [Limimaricola hongkongensis]EYD70674.1 hypothetical protein Lokhon_02315 [Limimaricola hongkongensis DSM 17492]
MSHRWMFDVLTDLETYARRNGLPKLALRLSEAAGQATQELAAAPRADRGERPLPPMPPPARAE